MFSLLVDEAKDVSKAEQVLVVVRFVDIKDHFMNIFSLLLIQLV